MSTGTFITKQHVKYYLKVMRRDNREDTTDTFDVGSDDFWQYEQTPRAIT